MATLLTLDPRVVVPDSVSLQDPSHPLNVVRQTHELQQQASADAKYDIPTPERFRKAGSKEGFSASNLGNMATLGLVLGILVLLGLLWMAVQSKMRPIYILVLGLLFSLFFFLSTRM